MNRHEAETLIQFGEGGRLIATFTPAAGNAGRKPTLGVLLFNAGVVARMGPHRMNVKLARRLSALGYPALRFDLSGQGDSGPASGSLDYHEQTAQDIGNALDTLGRTAGIERFVIIGLCSGAQAGWHAALRDPRIVGLTMIDGHVYPSRWTSLAHRWQRWRVRPLAERLGLLGRILGRWWPGQPAAANPPVPQVQVDDDVPVAPTSREQYAQGMQRLADRGVRMLIVFTSGWMRYYSYRGQFRTVFGSRPFVRQVRLEFAPQLDHTMTLLEGQQTMMEWVEEWIATC